MLISTNGLLVNQFNQVLLIQRNDTRTWALPGGAIDKGELPPDAAAREVREETGLIVMPVRLVGLHMLNVSPTPYLGFSFRCIQRGGEIQTSEESPQVGFVPALELPRAMAGMHRQRIERGMSHFGGPPEWYVQQPSWRIRLGRMALQRVVYPWYDFQRKRNGRPPYTPPPSWQTSAFCVIRNEAGAVLWVKRRDVDAWNLPGGLRQGAHEPPWKTAVRETREETGLKVQLTDLTGVYVYRDATPHMVFTFTATIRGGVLTTGAETAAFDWFQLGAEPPNSVQQHLERAADAASPFDRTEFRYQEGPHLVLPA